MEFRRTFEQIAGETGEDCGGYSGGQGPERGRGREKIFLCFFCGKICKYWKKVVSLQSNQKCCTKTVEKYVRKHEKPTKYGA